MNQIFIGGIGGVGVGSPVNPPRTEIISSLERTNIAKMSKLVSKFMLFIIRLCFN